MPGKTSSRKTCTSILLGVLTYLSPAAACSLLFESRGGVVTKAGNVGCDSATQYGNKHYVTQDKCELTLQPQDGWVNIVEQKGKCNVVAQSNLRPGLHNQNLYAVGESPSFAKRLDHHPFQKQEL